jgi:chromosome segregation ATPase
MNEMDPNYNVTEPTHCSQSMTLRRQLAVANQKLVDQAAYYNGRLAEEGRYHEQASAQIRDLEYRNTQIHDLAPECKRLSEQLATALEKSKNADIHAARIYSEFTAECEEREKEVQRVHRVLAAAQAELDDAWHSIGDRTEGLDLATHIESLKAQKESLAERIVEARKDTERTLTILEKTISHLSQDSVSVTIWDEDDGTIVYHPWYLEATAAIDAARKREEPKCSQS